MINLSKAFESIPLALIISNYTPETLIENLEIRIPEISETNFKGLYFQIDIYDDIETAFTNPV